MELPIHMIPAIRWTQRRRRSSSSARVNAPIITLEPVGAQALLDPVPGRAEGVVRGDGVLGQRRDVDLERHRVERLLVAGHALDGADGERAAAAAGGAVE